MNTLGSFDLIPVLPVTPGILYVIVKNKLIHCGNDVKIALPRDVVGLEDGYFFH